MLGRLILLIIFAVIVLSVLKLIKKTPQSQQKALYWKIGLGTLGIALVLLAVTGRIHWIGAMIGALLPLLRQALPALIRFFPLLQPLFNRKTQAAGPSPNCSEVQTALLKMTLNHDTQQLSGEVISGPMAGQQLDSLDLAQLQSLLDYCHQKDEESSKILLTYLTHRFGSDWQQPDQPGNSAELTEQSALDILGLKAGASKEDIIRAHRRIMQKVHPDRGGSDFLAAQTNAAKDFLLGKLS